MLIARDPEASLTSMHSGLRYLYAAHRVSLSVSSLLTRTTYELRPATWSR